MCMFQDALAETLALLSRTSPKDGPHALKINEEVADNTMLLQLAHRITTERASGVFGKVGRYNERARALECAVCRVGYIVLADGNQSFSAGRISICLWTDSTHAATRSACTDCALTRKLLRQ
jgi:hypothetical protein